MIKEAVVLAGGLGTRLRSVVAELPKCMAPINGIPFIHFIVAYLQKEGIEKFIFSLGYKSEIIISYLDEIFPQLQKRYIIETVQLGTGGAIKKALGAAETDHPIVLNGDTLFNVDITRLSDFHQQQGADCTLALKEMTAFSRYGSVEIGTDGGIRAFHEKRFCEKGYINGGVYALNAKLFSKDDTPEVFSFEKWLEENTGKKKLFGNIHNNYFKDIGIPEDYQQFTEDYNQAIVRQVTPNTTASIFSKDFFELLHSTI